MNKLLIAFVVAFIDQISKNFIRDGMNKYDSIDIIGSGFLRFTFLENKNIAFGLDLGFFNHLVLWLSILIVFVLIYLIITNIDSNNLDNYGLSFILGGAIGNIIDRICVFFNFSDYEGVTDFIDMPNILYYFGIMESSRWFIFNIADISISIGAILFLLSGFNIRANSDYQYQSDIN